MPCRAAPSEQCPESFNTRLRDELLNGEIFCSLRAAKIIIGSGAVTTSQSGLMPTRLQTTVCARIRCRAGFATSTGSTTLELPPALN